MLVKAREPHLGKTALSMLLESGSERFKIQIVQSSRHIVLVAQELLEAVWCGWVWCQRWPTPRKEPSGTALSVAHNQVKWRCRAINTRKLTIRATGVSFGELTAAGNRMHSWLAMLSSDCKPWTSESEVQIKPARPLHDDLWSANCEPLCDLLFRSALRLSSRPFRSLSWARIVIYIRTHLPVCGSCCSSDCATNAAHYSPGAHRKPCEAPNRRAIRQTEATNIAINKASTLPRLFSEYQNYRAGKRLFLIEGKWFELHRRLGRQRHCPGESTKLTRKRSLNSNRSNRSDRNHSGVDQLELTSLNKLNRTAYIGKLWTLLCLKLICITIKKHMNFF